MFRQALLITVVLLQTIQVAADVHAAFFFGEVSRGACTDADFEFIQYELTQAVLVGLAAEAQAGAPKDGPVLYSDAAYVADAKESLHEVEQSLTWSGTEGGARTMKERMAGEEEEHDAGRRLWGSSWCSFMCASTGQYCYCASGGRRRLEEGPVETVETFHSESNVEEEPSILESDVEEAPSSLRGAVRDEHILFNSRQAVTKRFQNIGKYDKLVWEYEMGSDIAESFIQRRIDYGDMPCLAWPLDVTVIIARDFA